MISFAMFLAVATSDATRIYVPSYQDAIAYSVDIPNIWIDYAKNTKPTRGQPTRNGQVFLRCMPDVDITLMLNHPRKSTKASYLKGIAESGKGQKHIPIKQGKFIGDMFFVETKTVGYGQASHRVFGSVLLDKGWVLGFTISSYKEPIRADFSGKVVKVAESIKFAP